MDVEHGSRCTAARYAVSVTPPLHRSDRLEGLGCAQGQCVVRRAAARNASSKVATSSSWSCAQAITTQSGIVSLVAARDPVRCDTSLAVCHSGVTPTRHRAHMHRSLKFLGVVLAPALLVPTACGGDEKSTSTTDATSTTTAPTTTAPTTTAPTTTTDPADSVQLMHPGKLKPGVHVGNKFDLPVTFTVGDGWEGIESRGSLVLYEVLSADSTLDVGGELGILNTVADLSIDEVVAELTAVEEIEFSVEADSTIAGLEGLVLTSKGSPDEVTFGFLYDPAFESPWYAAEGVRHEVHVLDAETGTVIVWIDALPDGWDTFRPLAQTVLDSIVWEE